ncbi:U-box domain-containing protein 8-like [Impatiens glandulifera]|uniref:U-box domain-containing protein 8-like n=1 Tax=Impatiens glandulifera TaxID=253017 RepID=UPI001FB16AD6|nr:U-box domain-containing protein 8-like [Impatiens glandulifera]
MAATKLPDDFKCPISLEIMSDPVILSSGHTFDRSSIRQWLDAGHRTCPITKLPLSDPPTLIPNHSLRSLISNYTLVPFPAPLNPEPKFLISSLLTPYSSPELKLSSLDQLSRLSKRDSGLCRRLIENDVVSTVLNFVSSDDSVLQEKALTLLLNLSLDDHNKVGLVAEGAIGRVVTVLCGGGSPDCRAVAATTLTSLAVVEVNKATIGAYPCAIQGLVFLLRDGNVRERKEAATALYTLCCFPDNRRRTVESGAVMILMGVIAGSGLERAVQVLSLLTKCKEGREEMMKIRDFGMSILVNVLRKGSSRGIQYALLTLISICSYSNDVCLEAMRQMVFKHCLALLEDDDEKIRRNASSLVQILGGIKL